MVRILGIDPGSVKTGYGIVEVASGRPVHVDNGVVLTRSSAPLESRLLEIHRELQTVIDRYQPTIAVVESLFHHKNARSALVLGHARGVAILAAVAAGLSVVEYAPAEVKRSVAGNGRAEKTQVQQMVRLILGLPEVAQEDASDALALAIHHAWAASGPLGRGRSR